MGKLMPLPLGISEFDKTYGIEKKTHRATKIQIFIPRGVKNIELHEVEGQPTKHSKSGF